ncbi:MAG: hypothetical protein P8016_11115 [Sedimentisphaerales bacterium]
MRQLVNILIVNMFLSIPLVASADEFNLSVKQGYAPLSGYLQTPAGGEPGTSDIRRPTLKELNVDDTDYMDVDLYYKKGKYTPYVGARWITIDSSGLLEKDLTSKNHTFLKGTSFDHETSFNIYRVGVKYDFKYFRPKLEAALMDFNYKLESAGIRADRSYAKSTIRMGAEKTFKIDALDIQVETSWSIPLPNTPRIYTVGTGVKYWFAKNINIGFDAQYFYLDYEDEQELPNHLRLEMKPALSLSLQYRF